MKNYKIIRGYSSEDYIEIGSDELEKAYYSFLTKKDAVYTGGAVRGSEILAIQPDYHKSMGWNRGHKLGPDDYEQLSDEGISKSHMNYLAEVKDRVSYLMQTNQLELIGQNISIPALKSSIGQRGGIKSIGEIINKTQDV